jgi:multiple sugar transport system ATP-binding protein
MAGVRLDRVTVVTDRVRRLDGVSLDVPDGAFIGVVGPSGSGKSSLLRAIAGLDRLTAGTIHFGADDVTDTSPAQRDVGVVFQEPALLPNRTVRCNVSFPLDIRKRNPEEIRQRVDAEVRALGIEALLQRRPEALSHGEQQMVQIARTLVRMPRVLLLDEPFASLDEALRQRMRSEIAMLQDGYGVTTIMTTNDPADLALVGSVAVVHEGLLVQYGSTQEVRRRPASMVAAAVTGWVSLIEMTVVADGPGVWLMREDPAGGELVRVRSWTPELSSRSGRRVVVGVRPQDLVVSDQGTIPAVVEQSLPVPAASLRCRIAGVRVTVGADRHRRFAPGDVVRLRLDHFTVFDPVTELAIGV